MTGLVDRGSESLATQSADWESATPDDCGPLDRVLSCRAERTVMIRGTAKSLDSRPRGNDVMRRMFRRGRAGHRTAAIRLSVSRWNDGLVDLGLRALAMQSADCESAAPDDCGPLDRVLSCRAERMAVIRGTAKSLDSRLAGMTSCAGCFGNAARGAG